MAWRDQWERSALLNESDWSVDWSQAGLTAVGAVLAAYLDAASALLATLIETFLITPANDMTREIESIVSSSTTVAAGFIDFGPATAFASDTGIIGSLVVIVIGGYILAVVYNRVIADG